MKKFLILIILSIVFFAFSGCGLTPTEFRTQNRQNLQKLSIDMTKENVLSIMGTEEQNLLYAGKINNPYKSEIFHGKNEVFEVLYYYTDKKREHLWRGDFVISQDELTPLIFNNGKLFGWGWGFWKQNIQKYEVTLR